MNGAGYEYQACSNAGLHCFSEMVPQLFTNPSWLHGNDGSDLSLHLGVANATDLSNVPLETPTFDRHVPAVHVSCRAADTAVFVEQSSEQPVVRSWIAAEPMTLAPELAVPDVDDLCNVVAPDVNDFYGAPLAPELSIKMPDVNDFCGVPLETPTLD